EDVSELLVWNVPEYRGLPADGKAVMKKDYMDFSEIIGQEGAKRGLEIAAAGGHNVIMIGSPGSGKSSLAKAMSGILPPMDMQEAIVTSKIYSVAGRGGTRYGLIRERPFRAPHYSASMAAIIGGGNGDNIMPGEVSLAQSGILFLDEFAQMPKSITEALRGPLEDRKVVISRLRSKVEYPASFMMVAATNPCPCGYYGEGDRCTCTPSQRMNYLARLSGPIMDRIDVQLWLHPVQAGALVRKRPAESSAAVAERVRMARDIQRERLSGEGIFTNAEMNHRQMGKFCPLDKGCKDLMEKIISRMGLSARAFTRVIRLARTIADLAGIENISREHLMEAAGYRFLDRRDLDL
ncbi:MAG: YifB family Mg chelatase-like AAA ATPase, partial [Bacteroidales bacterium]|nr:YifB family Mg chelatase-like AAA ATPase [Bacteroidales bacterium]